MLTFASLIQSKLFTFYVGEEEKPVVVHAAVIAATGQYFNALINGGMKESEQGSAKLADVRFDDFLRFCEFAYSGNYTAPPRTDKKGHNDFLVHALAHARLYCFANFRLIEPLRVLALQKIGTILRELDDAGSKKQPDPSPYILGSIELARYVYSDASNLPERKPCGKVDELRHRVSKNVVDNLVATDDTPELISLMDEGRQFAWDFWMHAKDHCGI
jgi:hypothetical protein